MTCADLSWAKLAWGTPFVSEPAGAFTMPDSGTIKASQCWQLSCHRHSVAQLRRRRWQSVADRYGLPRDRDKLRRQRTWCSSAKGVYPTGVAALNEALPSDCPRTRSGKRQHRRLGHP